MSEELPEGWTLATPDDLSKETRHSLAIGPFGSNLKVSDYTEAGVPLVFVRDIRAERFGGSGTRHVTAAKARDLAAHTVRPGDLMVTKMGEPPGDTAVYPTNRPAAIITADCIKLSPDPRATSARFLKHCLRAPDVRRQIAQRAMGVAQQKLSLERFRTIQLPLPPVAEQDRIVEAVEGLLAHLKVARARLGNVPHILRRFRQSVLAAACSGRLTQEWRAELPELTVCDFGREAGDQWLEPMFEHRENSELPPTWRYVALGNLGSWGSGGTPSKAREDFWKEGTVPWISPKDMKVNLIGDSQDHITDLAVQSGATMVPRGTLLFVVRGMILAHTFPVGLTTRSVTFNQDIRSIVPRREVHSMYVLHALQREGSNVLFAVKEATHGTLRLESSTLRRWPIAVPPREEQAEIVRRIDLFMALADTIERSVAAASTRAEALTQSILAKAFRGELVPTEAELARADGRDYESGEALLARIRGERAPIVPPSKGHRGRSLRAGSRS